MTTAAENGSESNDVLKADVLGRVKVPAEKREELLDVFEASGLSGKAFAEQHGINVQTFATWIQKRRRARGDYDDEAKCRKLRMPRKRRKKHKEEPTPGSMNLIEVQVGAVEQDDIPALEVALPSGAVVRVSSERQFGLLKSLLREFSC